MSIKIIGGTSGIDAEVDTTSKALRSTLYDSAGNEIASPPAGSYIAQIDLRPGAITVGSTTTLWSMRNGATKTCFLRRIFAQGSVNPTTAAASSWYYALARFSTATPSGGSAATALKKRTGYSNSTVADVRQIASGATGGLTITSVVFESNFSIWTGPRSDAAAVVLDMNFYTSANERFNSFELAPNEGLAILAPVNNVVAGDFLTGHIEWD